MSKVVKIVVAVAIVIMVVFGTYSCNTWLDSKTVDKVMAQYADLGDVRTEQARVVGVDNNLVTLQDDEGFVWCMLDVDYKQGDTVMLTIADSTTEIDRTDDVIVDHYLIHK